MIMSSHTQKHIVVQARQCMRDAGGEHPPPTRDSGRSSFGRVDYYSKVGKHDLIITNVYIPPASFCTVGYNPSLDHLMMTTDTLLLGDFNAHPKILIEDSQLPLVHCPKILGVHLYTSLSFNKNSSHVAESVSSRNNILKALAGTSWGQQRETLLMTYKAVERSIINYDAPGWSCHSFHSYTQNNWNIILLCFNYVFQVNRNNCKNHTSPKI